MGSSYPPSTMTVSVTGGAASVTNTVSLFGINETSYSNNTASDPTKVNQVDASTSILIVALTFTGCGGGGSSSGGPPPPTPTPTPLVTTTAGTYSITVTASGTSASSSAPVTLIVQ